MKSIRNKNSQQRRVRSVSCSATPAKVITEPLRMLALRRSLTLASHNRSSFRQFASFQPPSLSISTPSPTTGDSVGLPQEKSKSNSTRYTVYKSRAAVEFTPLAPTIVVDERGYKNVQRQGCLLLIFAQSTGTRSYDWDNKIIFALSVGELGQILATPTQEHEFFHDPGMQTSEQTVVTKRLKISNAADNGRFLSIRNQNKRDEKQTKDVSVSLSAGEFEIFKILAQYLIPRLLAFDKAL